MSYSFRYGLSSLTLLTPYVFFQDAWKEVGSQEMGDLGFEFQSKVLVVNVTPTSLFLTLDGPETLQ